MNIPVVYDDQWLLVVDKPSGLLVIPTPKKETRTLTSILNDEIKNRGQTTLFHPCHRLDRETSGLIIYAKGKAIQKKMMEEFKHRRVKKKYIAFVKGHELRKEGRINSAIEGLEALTLYKVIAKRKDFAIVEVAPLTGRTNQIRIHFCRIGHPVLGETKYAFRRDFRVKAKRLFLHAQELCFRHPVSGAPLCLSAGLAQDMKGFLENHED